MQDHFQRHARFGVAQEVFDRVLLQPVPCRHQPVRPDRRAILALPPPRVQSANLDQQNTKLIGLSTNGLWLIMPDGDDADAAISDLAYRRGEEIVAAAAADPELAGEAREQAERVIQSFVQPLQWKIEIRWSSQSVPVPELYRDWSGLGRPVAIR